jgi:hypothetical protein
MGINDMNLMNEKLQFFLDNKTKVHIDLKDGTFLNGFILKKIRDDVWWLEEDKIGEVFVFLGDIEKIQQNFNFNKEEKK